MGQEPGGAGQRGRDDNGTLPEAGGQSRSFDFTGAIDGKPYPEHGSGNAGSVSTSASTPAPWTGSTRGPEGEVLRSARSRISAGCKTLTREVTANTGAHQMKWTEVDGKLPPPPPPGK